MLWPPRMIDLLLPARRSTGNRRRRRSRGRRCGATRRPRCARTRLGSSKYARGAARPAMTTSPTSPGATSCRRRRRSAGSTPGQRSPDRAQVRPAVAQRHGGDGAELGHAVAAQDVGRRAAAAPNRRSVAGGDGRAADADDDQAREVGRLEARVGHESCTMAGTRKRRHRAVRLHQRPASGPGRTGAGTTRSCRRAWDRRRGGSRWWWRTATTVMKPSPSHSAGTRSIDDSPPWRTTTPLGAPVVPEVYMMSATSSAAGAVVEVGTSSEKSRVQRRRPDAPEPPVHGDAGPRAWASRVSTLAGQEHRQARRGAGCAASSGRLEAGVERARPRRPPCGWPCTRRATRAARPRPMASATRSPGATPASAQPAGQPVGSGVPLAEGELAAVGQVLPGHRRRGTCRASSASSSGWSRVTAGRVTRALLSTARRPRGWCRGFVTIMVGCRRR